MRKGDIWLIELPESPGGKEQKGTRPGVIVAGLEAEMAMVIPLTTQKRSLRFLNVFEIESASKNGLTEDSIALVFQLRAIDARRLIKKIGALEKAALTGLDAVLAKMLNLG